MLEKSVNELELYLIELVQAYLQVSENGQIYHFIDFERINTQSVFLRGEIVFKITFWIISGGMV